MPPDNYPSPTQNDDVPSPSVSHPCRHDDAMQTPPPYHNRQTPPTSQMNQDVNQQNDPVLEQDSYSSDAEEPQEFAYVDLQTIRKEVQCPICLGIIKKTRTVMECLHRFCRECIDKSMRMGNNECPACRTHCASRRSLRDDPRYDAIIAALYPDIKKFEDEELAFCEEDETRNKQIQDSIAEVLRRQSEVAGKKRPAKETASPSNVSKYPSRKRRRQRRRNTSPDYQDSDDNDADDMDKHFETYEHDTESKQKKGKSRVSIGSSRSPSVTSFENNQEENNEARGLSPGLLSTTERLAWGKGGARSNTRNSNVNGGVRQNARCIRLAKLVEFLRNLEDNDAENFALSTSLPTENAQLPALANHNGSFGLQSTPHPSSSSNQELSQVVDTMEDRLHLLERDRTLAGAIGSCISNGEKLIVAYQQKEAI